MANPRFIKVTALDENNNEAEALINLDNIITAIQEEKFTRVYMKYDCELHVKEKVEDIFTVLNNPLGL